MLLRQTDTLLVESSGLIRALVPSGRGLACSEQRSHLPADPHVAPLLWLGRRRSSLSAHLVLAVGYRQQRPGLESQLCERGVPSAQPAGGHH